jgi:hypothetical protein
VAKWCALPCQAHFGTQVVKQVLAVSWFVHINKIDHHNTTHIAQAQLAGNFFSRFAVYLVSVLFLVFFIGCTVTAVNVNNVQGFCMLNNQVSATGKVNCFTKGAFNLLYLHQNVQI